MTTAISIEDVRREVKIMKALSGHEHMIKFHDAFEDANNVYIVMEYVHFYCNIYIYLLVLFVIFFFPFINIYLSPVILYFVHVNLIVVRNSTLQILQKILRR